MADDEWRVEVDLDDEHGVSLGERLRALDLDDDARKRLGDRVIVTRDGSRILLYARTENDALEAERVARELVEKDGLTADFAVTRWHPVAQEWKDRGLRLPDSPADIATEQEEAERGRLSPGIPDPRFVYMEAYKPEFLRDLGL